MATFSPQETAKGLIRNLRTAYDGCYWLASQQNVPVLTVTQRIDQIRNGMTSAHDSLLLLQGSFSNAVIAERVAMNLEPPPADLPAAYTNARTLTLAMLDHYGASIVPVLPFPYTWDGVTRLHVEVMVNLDNSPTFKNNLIAARDALEVFY